MQDDKSAVFQMRFPQKLWYLLNLRTDAILWGGTGRTILLNYRILGKYLQCDHSVFKTTNISSFVRQLNLYGFRKVTSHLQDPLCNSSNPYMHEYVHDYFQYGRPELLNKITRKALAMKKNTKPKVLYGNVDQLLYLTPLQKARRALKVALRKATQNIVLENSPKQCNKFKLEYEDYQDDFCDDEETMELDWLSENNGVKSENCLPKTEITQEYPNKNMEENSACGEISQDNLMNFNDETSSQTTYNFSGQFLNMPVLEPEPTETCTRMELLAEFNIDNDAVDGIERKINSNKVNVQNSLNCVLPSVSNDQNDDVTISENNSGQSTHYHGDWEQMLNDIMINKGPNQDGPSDLKELYSQISKTIDLLNT